MKKKKWLFGIAIVLVALLIFALATGDTQTREKLPAMLTSIAIGIVVLLVVLTLAWLYSRQNEKREAHFRANAEAIMGRVRKVERMRAAQPRDGVYGVGEDMYMLRAEYDYAGKHYDNARRVYFGRPAYNAGDEIVIYVNPQNPGKSMILPENKTEVQA